MEELRKDPLNDCWDTTKNFLRWCFRLMPGWQIYFENCSWVVVFLLLFPVWNEELCHSLHSSLGVLLVSEVWGHFYLFSLGVKFPPFHWKGQSPYSQGLFLEAARGWAGIGLGTFAWIAAISKFKSGLSCSGTGGSLQLRVTASEPFSQVGHCAFFTLKSSLKLRGAVLFSLGKPDFFPLPFTPPTFGFGNAASWLLPLVT